MSTAQARIAHIDLDARSVVRWSADIDHERRVAIFDLLEENVFSPDAALTGGYAGPYRVLLRIEEGRLAMDLKTDEDAFLATITVSANPFRRIVREYFAICDAYFSAARSANPGQLEAIDMGRRGLHNEGSQLLMERLEGKVAVDFNTARRLFTLMCVLHIRA